MAGLNSDTKLLLHCDGINGSTTFTDSRLTNPHTVTAHGTAQIDTSVKKWGTGSGSFDGNSDYLTIPDSPDWDVFGSNSDNWTIDFWTRESNDPTDHETYMSHYDNSSNFVRAIHHSGGFFDFRILYSGVNILNLISSTDTTTDRLWHHIAIIKIANIWGLYIDGVQEDYKTNTTTGTISGLLYLGRHAGILFLDARIDEFRIQKSNYFNASPNIGETDTITVPTEAYTYDAPSGLYIPTQSFILT